MPNSPTQPVVIRCPHSVLCASAILCKAFEPSVKTEVLKADLCPEARSKRHAAESVERFKQAEEPSEVVTEPVFQHDAHTTGTPTVELDTHFEVAGDENE